MTDSDVLIGGIAVLYVWLNWPMIRHRITMARVVPVTQTVAAEPEPVAAAAVIQAPSGPQPLAIVSGGPDSHEIISEHDPHHVIHSPQHHHAFQVAMKDALRTPGMGVRWHDGHIEWGQE